MKPFVLLAEPEKYVACDWDLAQDAEARAHWVPFFKRHFRTILSLGKQAEMARGGEESKIDQRVADCAKAFDERFDAWDAAPTSAAILKELKVPGWDGGGKPVTILTLDLWRDEILRKFGFVDCFVDLKERENEKTLPLLAEVCKQIDMLTGKEQVRAVVEGVFAGNIFDMGAEATSKMFLEAGNKGGKEGGGGAPTFFSTREKLPKRPWLFDDYDKLEAFLLEKGKKAARKAVFFIDNAGSDFLLGALVMMRYLCRSGWRVVMAANERPTLNDMTIHDVRRWWPRVLAAEPSLKDCDITAVSSGTGEPLIDLSAVSDELNAAATGADLLIIEGMGRGVESNLFAKFVCPSLNIAMIKDPSIAKLHGGKLYDCVLRFR